ncbi:hypothetical protein [Draconibacterium halophilum]|uniref:PAS domain-containing protein n=1 Tax=Draconibacterium halophilum TaxID=2706887 RepID=A0A6C0RHR7_9BACT|nr:hypothetical protein [Draconibacterium halophilum]QIA09556.1 hypothetical protein G0Q07_18395 [Draconibacterium halophilum]
MQSKKTMANHSFDMLTESSEFMNLVLDNITNCVLLLDKDMRLQAFNKALKTIFSNKADEDLLYMRCGEAIGCAYQIEEAKDCGKTSKCCTCELRLAAFDSYLNNSIIYKKHIRRPFFTQNGEREMKDLQFSTRQFYFRKEKYIILIIDDITGKVPPSNVPEEK